MSGVSLLFCCGVDGMGQDRMGWDRIEWDDMGWNGIFGRFITERSSTCSSWLNNSRDQTYKPQQNYFIFVFFCVFLCFFAFFSGGVLDLLCRTLLSTALSRVSWPKEATSRGGTVPAVNLSMGKSLPTKTLCGEGCFAHDGTALVFSQGFVIFTRQALLIVEF